MKKLLLLLLFLAPPAFAEQLTIIAPVVAGLGTTVDTRVPKMNGTSGTLMTQSNLAIDSSNNLTGVNSITANASIQAGSAGIIGFSTSSRFLNTSNGVMTVTANNGTTKAQFVAGSLQVTVVAIGSLPTCNSGNEGLYLGVTDASSPVALATVAAGGSAHVPVYCNGTNWIVP